MKGIKSTSEFRGVSWIKPRSIYYSSIIINHKSIALGCFDNEIDAAIAYDCAVKSFNVKRKINFPNPEPENLIPNTRLVRLTQGKFAVVDNEDFEIINKYNWFTKSHCGIFYAEAAMPGNNKKKIKMHNLIMNPLQERFVII